VSVLREHFHQKCQVFVDDWILFASPDLINGQHDDLLQVLKELGWMINFEKSDLDPSCVKH
jgi:hypothetical protein